MSKVYVEMIDEYICDALDAIRKMNENRDYSGLAAVVERIQQHANKMEKALWRGKDTINGIFHIVAHSKDKDDAEKLKAVAKTLIEYNEEFEERFKQAEKQQLQGIPGLDYYG